MTARSICARISTRRFSGGRVRTRFRAAAWIVSPAAELGAGLTALLGFQIAPAVAARIAYTAATLSTGGNLNVGIFGSHASAQIICSPFSNVDLYGTVGADVLSERSRAAGG